MYEDKTLKCKDCGQEFVFKEGGRRGQSCSTVYAYLSLLL